MDNILGLEQAVAGLILVRAKTLSYQVRSLVREPDVRSSSATHKRT